MLINILILPTHTIVINIVITIIALTICKYTLPKNFINNNFKTFLLILALIYSILRTPIFYEELKIVKTKYTSNNEYKWAKDIHDYVNFKYIFIIYSIACIIKFFILGYIMKSLYPNIENNYEIFSIPLVIL